MIIVFAGSIGRFPVGGHAWVDLQYLLGLEALGHEVYYLEDCGHESWVYDWEAEALTNELGYPTSYLRSCLEGTGLEGRWIYRAGDATAGMALPDFLEALGKADLLIVRGSPLDVWREEYDRPHRRAYIDSDPGFTQFHLAKGSRELARTVERCETLFTVGQRIGAADCPVPTGDRTWHRMLPPVSLPHWPARDDGGDGRFTAILQWKSYREVSHGGIAYGNKDREFPRFMDLPRRTSQPFRMALTGATPETLTKHGWEVVSGWVATFAPSDYARFIRESRAELGIAKHGYVAARTGWFSDRSACYLASGRPVLVQDTGLEGRLAAGRGIVTFSDIDGAVRAVEAVNADYEAHRRAARALAEDLFGADRVLPEVIEKAMG